MKSILKDLATTAGLLWQKGWAEANAGNISVNMTGVELDLESEFIASGHVVSPVAFRSIGNRWFIAKASGKRMRDVAHDPLQNCAVIHVDSKGDGYIGYYHKSVKEPLIPTSELPSHLAVHDILVKQKSPSRAVVHTHCPELIALTHLRELQSTEAFSKLVWKMIPECAVFLPHGVGYVPYLVPGSVDIAKATAAMVSQHDLIIWGKHGALAIAGTCEEAFDKIDLAAKAAFLFLTCRNAGFEPEGLTNQQISFLRTLGKENE
ncbi:MAG: rhamnulose-1-phosphate aldolase [Bacteroidetes bacterium]|nr:rhamnulose-1-phosphate aldolase [Bacteroidota bacterium]